MANYGGVRFHSRVVPGMMLALAASVLFGCSDSSNGLGTITTVAGNGTPGDSGDGKLAIAAQLSQPTCVVADAAGNLYIGDVITNSVRRVDAKTGLISTYAGNGVTAYTGDGGSATSASIYGPTACTIDSAGNLYIADVGNNVIRKVDASDGVISTVAGNGSSGFSGDGAVATKAELNTPYGVAVDESGNLFISDYGNQRMREVMSSTGNISTIAGNGTYGYSGSSGLAIDSMLANPEQLALRGGDLYIVEQGSSVVSQLDLSSGTLKTIAGDGTPGDGTGSVRGDGGAAIKAQLAGPQGLAFDAVGNLFIADSNNQRIREVSVSTGIIDTVVGTTTGYSGQNGSAAHAKLHNP
jgi:sugar lactone lactonase YvrE